MVTFDVIDQMLFDESWQKFIYTELKLIAGLNFIAPFLWLQVEWGIYTNENALLTRQLPKK